MTAAIFANEGYISKFIGDGLMATFGAVSSNPWQMRDALLAAIDMRRALASYNEELLRREMPQIQIDDFRLDRE